MSQDLPAIVPPTASLERAVRRFVEHGTDLSPAGQRVIKGDGRGPAPNGLYVSVLVISQVVEGTPYQDVSYFRFPYDWIGTVSTVRGTFSVQFYRAGARDLARRFVVWCSSPSGLEAAAELNLTFLRASDVRQLDAIISDDWEERASIDLEIGYVESFRELTPIIRSVPVRVAEDRRITVDVNVVNE